MNSRLNTISRKSPIALTVAAFLLFAAGTALAASDLSSLVSTGDGGQASGRAAQQPLGGISATPQAPEGDVQGNVETGGGGEPGKQEGSTVVAPTATSGSESDSLPFTGLLAIPILLIGAVLLVAGTTLSRGGHGSRSQAQPTA